MGATTLDAAMRPSHLKLTIEDYELFPDDGQRHELIDGEHVVTAAPVVHHQRVLVRLVSLLHVFVEEHGLGEVLPAPTDVVLSRHDVLQPDVLFVSSARSAIVTRRIEGAPDLAVEVLSPSSRRTDEVLKRRRYETFAVAELWIVDPEIDVVRVYRRESSERFGRPAELAAERGDALETPLLPGLTVDLGRLFRRPPNA